MKQVKHSEIIEIWKPVYVADESETGQTKTLTKLCTVWASVIQSSGRRALEETQSLGYVPHRIEIRNNNRYTIEIDYVLKWKFRGSYKTLNIVEPPTYTRDFVNITATEQQT